MRKKRILFIIDAQNDFCTDGGSLANKKAIKKASNIVSFLEKHRKDYDCIVCTMDTHDENYANTIEGRHLPVQHCIKGTWGWLLNKKIYDALYDCPDTIMFEKNTFMMDVDKLDEGLYLNNVDEIDICGFATDICVLNNALCLKRKARYAEINLIEVCCAGTSTAAHDKAVQIMVANHINIVTPTININETNNQSL